MLIIWLKAHFPPCVFARSVFLGLGSLWLLVSGAPIRLHGQTPRVKEANGVLTLTIPSIVDHEVVAVDL